MSVPEPRLFVTDALGNPFVEEERLPQILQPIGRSRRDANKVKRSEPITVVIGNPPYKEKAKGRGGWIERGSDGREAPLDRWMPPAAWGVGAHAKHLKNKGSFGGRAYPLWRDSAGSTPNTKSGLLAYLARVYGQPVTPDDLMAYLAAVLAHPAFTARFASDLVRPGLRVPLTADAELFFEAVDLGRETIWLHTFGERFADAAAGRPARSPRLPKDEAPSIPADGAIPTAPEPLPDEIDYDPGRRRLRIGKG